MSTRVMGPAWDLELPMAPKFVLISLADQANDHGYCWPSVGTIQRRCGFKSERTVQDALRWLEHNQLVEVIQKPGRSNTYQINLSALQPNLFTPAGNAPPQEMHPRTKRTPPPQEMRGTPAGDAPKPSSNRKGNVNRPAARRDEIFEAVAEVCGIDWNELTTQSRGPLNNATKQLKELQADVQTIKARAAEYRRLYPDCTLTPSALVKHWPALKVKQKAAPTEVDETVRETDFDRNWLSSQGVKAPGKQSDETAQAYRKRITVLVNQQMTGATA